MSLPRPALRTAWRDSLIFLTGLGLTIYEAVIHEGPERWGLIILYASMMGLPVFLNRDEKTGAPAPTPPGEAGP